MECILSRQKRQRRRKGLGIPGRKITCCELRRKDQGIIDLGIGIQATFPSEPEIVWQLRDRQRGIPETTYIPC
jgi:hypothetical protein